MTLGYGTSRSGATDTWQLANVTGLPSGQNFFILAVGATPSGQGGSQGLVQSEQEFDIVATGGGSRPRGGAARTQQLGHAQRGGGSALLLSDRLQRRSHQLFRGGPSRRPHDRPTTGVISGTATQTGVFSVTLSFASILSSVQSVGSSAGVGVTTVPIVITVEPTPTGTAVSPASRLINISAIDGVTGSQSLSNGFVIGGTAPKTVLLRAVGPALTGFGVATPARLSAAAADRQHRTVILTNRGWDGSSTLMKIFAQVGAFPLSLGSTDCAVVTTLSPGSYALQISSGDGTGGSALAEIYDADVDPLTLPQRLVDLATMGPVGGANTLAGGFVGSGTSPKRLLIRADGPALTGYGVSPALAQPLLSIYDGKGALLAVNAGWGILATVDSSQPAATASDLFTAALSAGAFPLQPGSADSAVIVTLPPGAYSATVTPVVAGQSGTALVEIYELP